MSMKKSDQWFNNPEGSPEGQQFDTVKWYIRYCN